MKLHQLAIGARFEYQGKEFTKTGPITAAAELGGQQMIPRHADLKALDLPEPALAPGMAVRKLDPLRVRKAFDAFYEISRQQATPSGLAVLEAARLDFLSGLK